MGTSPSKEPLRRIGLAPLVRPTRNQAEVELLPPYGDPEVRFFGELTTFMLVVTIAVLLYRRFRRWG
jgi:hypothetical protein